MTNLITPQEFATYRNISQKLDESKINEAIGLAQQSDLLKTLGGFYFDVLKNSAHVDWTGLMNGEVFLYNDEEFEHMGVKKMLGDYTYARFAHTGNITPTPFGFQKKTTQDSEAVDRNTMKDLSAQAKVDAGIKFIFIEKYILSKPDLFSRYCKNNKQDTSFLTPKFSKL